MIYETEWIRLKYSTKLAIFSVTFIAATIAFARFAGAANVLHTRFVVSNLGPLTQSGNCKAHTGEASTAIAATDVIGRILNLELMVCNWVESPTVLERKTLQGTREKEKLWRHVFFKTIFISSKLLQRLSKTYELEL
jgi:hypothetical protein